MIRGLMTAGAQCTSLGGTACRRAGRHPGKALSPAISQEIQTCGQRIGELWNESLRYHNNVAYQHEVTKVRLAAEWLLANLESI